MRANSNKLTLLIKIFLFSLLIWIFQDAYETNVSIKTWNKKIYANDTLDVGISRLLSTERYVGSKDRKKHLKKGCFPQIMGCIDTSKYLDIILNTYDSTVSNYFLAQLYEKLKENANQNEEEYISREKEIKKYIYTLLFYLELKYKNKLKTRRHSNNEKYKNFLQILSDPKTKKMLNLTIPMLAVTHYSFQYIPYLDPSLDEVILSELISYANSILDSHKKLNKNEASK
ncbi:Plasmodium exported protein, unknown function [Plasmodium malariae]|uniref:Pv-fam-d protein n=1 Tax=Plasmodium malariae TaxID=5858 RepID=A0A1D3JI61_PLAMA|nr:Plasmodium exported protein, unknown function [Plasmodium malariae]SBT86154.1 Plasmodium exported protein, unknown function [Plasmodium malariae]